MQRRTLLTLPLWSVAAITPITRTTQAQAQAPATVLTRVETALGSFVIAVDPSRAPGTVANYLAYVDAKSLDSSSVYRIVTPANQPDETKHKISIVQWGLNLADEAKPRLPAIGHETTQQTGLRHLDGTLSMARNGPGTAAAEFFICIGDQPELDFGGRRNPDGLGFAAFGQVVAGLGVLQALYRLGQASQYVKPPVAVLTVRRVRAEEVEATADKR